MDRFALQDGAAAAFRLIDATNEFITERQPWALAKDPSKDEELRQVLYESAEALRISATLLLPVMPSSCAEILSRLGIAKPTVELRLDPDARWGSAGNLKTKKGEPLWPRLEAKSA
jgi:methionyl-tRNA synthetase